MLTIGIKNKETITVTEENTAKKLGSGLLPVFATPAMVALMESTASNSVLAELAENEGTVGISLNVKHISATPVGMSVYCISELVEIDKKRLVFEVEAYDETGLIGQGTHERFIIDNEKFMAKAEGKKGGV